MSACARWWHRSRRWNGTSGSRSPRAAPPSTRAPSDPVLYAYAISESSKPPEIHGLKGATLRAVGNPREGVCAIVSEHEKPPAAVDPEDLWAHEAVVEAAMQDGAVLPMRVGSSFADEADLVGALRARQVEFR